jgi:PncC family amidohydrolase
MHSVAEYGVAAHALYKDANGVSVPIGLVLGRLTDVPGSSAWVRGGVVAYANDVKTEQLEVAAGLIESAGAVSEPVAIAMAAGVRRRLGATIGVGVTGVAGPSGGTVDKPVGMVCIAVVDGTGCACGRSIFPGDRHTVRSQAVQTALDRFGSRRPDVIGYHSLARYSALGPSCAMRVTGSTRSTYSMAHPKPFPGWASRIGCRLSGGSPAIYRRATIALAGDRLTVPTDAGADSSGSSR